LATIDFTGLALGATDLTGVSTLAVAAFGADVFGFRAALGGASARADGTGLAGSTTEGSAIFAFGDFAICLTSHFATVVADYRSIARFADA
jgi:hypothetical protein